MSQHTHILIVGAGLAGCILAQTLLRKGIPGEHICLIDAKQAGQQSSGGIGFLLNPLPGRSLVPKQGYLEAFEASCQWLQAQPTGYEALPLLRPLLPNHKGSQRLLRSFEKAAPLTTPLIELTSLSVEESKKQCPHLANIEGSIRVTPAFSIWPERLFAHILAELQDNKVSLYNEHKLIKLRQSKGKWQADTQKSPFLAEKVVLSLGAGLEEFFPEATREIVGGALVSLQPPEGMELSCLLSGAGVHIAPRVDGQWILGATFEPAGTTPLSDKETIETLLARAEAFLPLVRSCKPTNVWREFRLVDTATKMPVFGAIPGHTNLYQLGAFGSKGLLMIPWMAQQVATLL